MQYSAGVAFCTIGESIMRIVLNLVVIMRIILKMPHIGLPENLWGLGWLVDSPNFPPEGGLQDSILHLHTLCK